MRRKAHLAMSPVGDIARCLKPTAANKAGNALRNVVGRVLDVGQFQLRVSERSGNDHRDLVPLRVDSVGDERIDRVQFNAGWASACHRESPLQMSGASPQDA